jgi:hypothetical protein
LVVSSKSIEIGQEAQLRMGLGAGIAAPYAPKPPDRSGDGGPPPAPH